MRTWARLKDGTPLVTKGLDIRLDLLTDQVFECGAVFENLVERAALFLQFLEFLLDLDVFELCQLPQSHVENVIGLPLGQIERFGQLVLQLATPPAQPIDAEPEIQHRAQQRRK